MIINIILSTPQHSTVHCGRRGDLMRQFEFQSIMMPTCMACCASTAHVGCDIVQCTQCSNLFIDLNCAQTASYLQQDAVRPTAPGVGRLPTPRCRGPRSTYQAEQSMFGCYPRCDCACMFKPLSCCCYCCCCHVPQQILPNLELTPASRGQPLTAELYTELLQRDAEAWQRYLQRKLAAAQQSAGAQQQQQQTYMMDIQQDPSNIVAPAAAAGVAPLAAPEAELPHGGTTSAAPGATGSGLVPTTAATVRQQQQQLLRLRCIVAQLAATFPQRPKSRPLKRSRNCCRLPTEPLWMSQHRACLRCSCQMPAQLASLLQAHRAWCRRWSSRRARKYTRAWGSSRASRGRRAAAGNSLWRRRRGAKSGRGGWNRKVEAKFESGVAATTATVAVAVAAAVTAAVLAKVAGNARLMRRRVAKWMLQIPQTSPLGRSTEPAAAAKAASQTPARPSLQLQHSHSQGRPGSKGTGSSRGRSRSRSRSSSLEARRPAGGAGRLRSHSGRADQGRQPARRHSSSPGGSLTHSRSPSSSPAHTVSPAAATAMAGQHHGIVTQARGAAAEAGITSSAAAGASAAAAGPTPAAAAAAAAGSAAAAAMTAAAGTQDPSGPAAGTRAATAASPPATGGKVSSGPAAAAPAGKAGAPAATNTIGAAGAAGAAAAAAACGAGYFSIELPSTAGQLMVKKQGPLTSTMGKLLPRQCRQKSNSSAATQAAAAAPVSKDSCTAATTAAPAGISTTAAAAAGAAGSKVVAAIAATTATAAGTSATTAAPATTPAPGSDAAAAVASGRAAAVPSGKLIHCQVGTRSCEQLPAGPPPPAAAAAVAAAGPQQQQQGAHSNGLACLEDLLPYLSSDSDTDEDRPGSDPTNHSDSRDITAACAAATAAAGSVAAPAAATAACAAIAADVGGSGGAGGERPLVHAKRTQAAAAAAEPAALPAAFMIIGPQKPREARKPALLQAGAPCSTAVTTVPASTTDTAAVPAAAPAAAGVPAATPGAFIGFPVPSEVRQSESQAVARPAAFIGPQLPDVARKPALSQAGAPCSTAVTTVPASTTDTAAVPAAAPAAAGVPAATPGAFIGFPVPSEVRQSESQAVARPAAFIGPQLPGEARKPALLDAGAPRPTALTTASIASAKPAQQHSLQSGGGSSSRLAPMGRSTAMPPAAGEQLSTGLAGAASAPVNVATNMNASSSRPIGTGPVLGPGTVPAAGGLATTDLTAGNAPNLQPPPRMPDGPYMMPIEQQQFHWNSSNGGSCWDQPYHLGLAASQPQLVQPAALQHTPAMVTDLRFVPGIAPAGSTMQGADMMMPPQWRPVGCNPVPTEHPQWAPACNSMGPPQLAGPYVQVTYGGGAPPVPPGGAPCQAVQPLWQYPHPAITGQQQALPPGAFQQPPPAMPFEFSLNPTPGVQGGPPPPLPPAYGMLPQAGAPPLPLHIFPPPGAPWQPPGPSTVLPAGRWW